MKNLCTFAVLLWFGAALGAAQTAPAQTSEASQAQPPISLSIRAVQPVVRAGSSVMLEVITKNISNQGIPDFRGSKRYYTSGLGLDVLDGNGTPARRTEIGERLRRGSDRIPIRNTVGGGGELSPGQAWEDLLYVTGPFDLSRPGEYTIRAGQRVPSGELVESNTVRVTVEDPAQYDQQFAQAGAPFFLTISTPEDIVKSGSDVPLRMYTSNLSGHEITFDCAKYDEQAFDASGNPLPWIGGAGLRKVIEAGNGHMCGAEAYGTEERLAAHVDKLYDLSQPGRYTVQASRFDDVTKTWVKSNTITLTVTP